MLKEKIKKVLYIKKLNLLLLYYKDGHIQKLTPITDLISQAKQEKILIIE